MVTTRVLILIKVYLNLDYHISYSYSSQHAFNEIYFFIDSFISLLNALLLLIFFILSGV